MATNKQNSVLPAAAMDEDDERHIFLLGRNVKIELLLPAASRHIRNVGDPGDTISSSPIGLLSHRPDLCIHIRDHRQNTANEHHRKFQNRDPPKLEKMPFHMEEGG